MLKVQEREKERNGSILCAGRKIGRKIKNRARDNFVCTYIMKIVNYPYRNTHTRSRSELTNVTIKKKKRKRRVW